MAFGNNELLNLSEDELDIQLGAALYQQEFGAVEQSDAQKKRRGEIWFAHNRDKFASVICKQDFIERYLQTKEAVERELFDAILSALAAIAGLPVPVGVLAAKIIRYGLTKLCSCTGDSAANPAIG